MDGSARICRIFLGGSVDGAQADVQRQACSLDRQGIESVFKVYNTLGYGFAERVYENALAIELRKIGLEIERQKDVTVYYEGEVVGDYVTDIVVNGVVMLELKAVRTLTEDHDAQLLNYLKATPVEVGLLLNFGEKPDHHRKIFDNDRKGSLVWHQPEQNP